MSNKCVGSWFKKTKIWIWTTNWNKNIATSIPTFRFSNKNFSQCKSELRVDDLVLSLGSFPFPGDIDWVCNIIIRGKLSQKQNWDGSNEIYYWFSGVVNTKNRHSSLKKVCKNIYCSPLNKKGEKKATQFSKHAGF